MLHTWLLGRCNENTSSVQTLIVKPIKTEKSGKLQLKCAPCITTLSSIRGCMEAGYLQEDTLEGTERSEAGRGWDCCSLEGSWSTLADWVGWEGGLLDHEG